MGKLHDKLESIGYNGHALELYLVRLLFCLFADDSNIFERGILYDYIDQRTNEDGSDLANHIAQLFQVLNMPKDKRFSNLDESLAAFPYVNGKLFEEHLPIASFDSEMRKLLLECCGLDWGKISPAIFGSLFQSVMNPVERRNLGAHYTSEKNILKLIKPLFLDELWKEFETAKESRPKLQKFHDRISQLRFLDPACGCGNFLIVAYRELRLLEIEIIKVLLFRYEKLRPEVALDARIDIGHLLKCDVDRFYGIEYEEFPAQIAQVAMWLIDHQMNMKASETFGEYYVRLPLRKSAVIKNGNALRTDWQSLIEPLPWEKL
jgi:type II restriction/modification system DNA methylase subunit YeeA